MYTQCPECATAFRVTADVLRKAAGKVRCGGCGHAFNALPFLTETRPAARARVPVDDALPELAPEPDDASGDVSDDILDNILDEVPHDIPGGALIEVSVEPDDSGSRHTISADQSAALLKTLDDLAGEDIQLEDTGVEWRLLGGEDDANNDEESFDDGTVGAGDDGTIDVVEFDGDIVEFSFDDTSTGLNALVVEEQDTESIADTRAPVDTGLFRGPTESRVDELLHDAPTPVDEFLTQTPNDVDAVEVFADDGAADIDASDVFASPETRPEDVLRFDDYTGLPENFDLDAPAEPAHAPEPPRAPVAEPQTTHAEIVFGDPDEWVDLLDEVGPFPASTPFADLKTNRDAVTDTGVNLVLDADVSAVASNDTDLEDTFAAAAETDDETDDEVDNEIDNEAAADEADDLDSNAVVVPALKAPDADKGNDADDGAHTVGALTLEEELAALSDDYDEDDEAADEATDEETAGDGAEAIVAVANDTDSANGREAPAARSHTFPGSTGELEFELEEAQRRSGEDLEFDPARTVLPPPTEEEQTVNMMIDADLMRLAIPDDDGMASTIVLEGNAAKRKSAPKNDRQEKGKDDSPANSLFETIVMEGDFTRPAQEQVRLAAEARARSKGDPEQVAQAAGQQDAVRARSRRMQYGLVAGVLVLVLLLAGQFVHQTRADLATIPAVGDAIAPIYRAVGAPITPDWNVSGWRFEVTRGSTGDSTGHTANALPDLAPGEEVLTIYSRLGNKSTDPLPYPLISVALTDRFEEVIGSKVIEPAEYLAIGTNSGDMIAPGATFDAVIAVASPADRAAGFKLNVCYRHDGDALRCAIEDFR